MSFKELGISEFLINALQRLEIIRPTPVQKTAIPAILSGYHTMVQAKTGSGKTLAFLLPIIEKLSGKSNEVLILEPTRELAKQVDQVLKELGNHTIKSTTIYGGVSIDRQIEDLEKGVNFICGTPGRLIDIYKRKKLHFNNIKFVVIDEADRLFDMGFAPDVNYILSKIRTEYQFLLFSATLYSQIRKLVKKHSKNDFKFINLSKDDLTVGNTKQYYYLIDRFEEKFSTFLHILKIENPHHTLVFVNTKKTASWLASKLKSKNNFKYRVDMISGRLTQHKREKILKSFREHKINMLIATDVAARGLDIENITHIINYDVPKYPDVYIHRIGRTSRMNKRGTAITLCLADEYEYLCHIEGLINKEIRQKTIEKRDTKRFHNPFY
ncbi:MAG: DEAD/DEAH box helicase [Candidatus Thorarchaeota archaeon]